MILIQNNQFVLSDGSLFIPRGTSLVRLTSPTDHSLFESSYDSDSIRKTLAAMIEVGNNIVKVFINPGSWFGAKGIGGPDDTQGLYIPYVYNVIDFLNQARAVGIYVYLLTAYFPFNRYYYKDIRAHLDISGWNIFVLNRTYVEAKKRYLNDLCAILQGYGDVIFALDIEPEIRLDPDTPPFSNANPSVETFDGQVHNLQTPQQRQYCADSNFVEYINYISRDIPFLTTCSVVPFAATGRSGPDGLIPNKGIVGYPARLVMLESFSRLDFLTIHVYPMNYLTFEVQLPSFEFHTLRRTKPILLGEYGAFKKLYPNTRLAMDMLLETNKAVKENELAGQIFWTWDCYEQPEYWNQDEAGGLFRTVLSKKAGLV